MAKIGKLKAALAAHKGVDYERERQKRLQKKAAKANRKQARQEEDTKITDIEVFEDDADEGGVKLDISKIDETSSSESEGFGDDNEDAGSRIDDEEDASLPHQNGVSLIADGQDGDEEDDDDDIPYSDIASLDSEEKGDITPHQRLTINNHAALNAALARIQLPISKLPFSAHQSITSAEPVEIKDVEDDLNRELQFYAQSLAAVKEGRRLLKLEGAPFSRPNDYFAEMVKSEDHMGRVKKKLVDEAASKRAASDARRQRDLKKFGKAVQVAKLQERDKAKKDALDRINVLKRKRSNALPTAEKEPDLFDIELEKESKPTRTSSKSGSKSGPNAKRQKKNEKYGFGGKKKFSKSGDAFSTSDMRDFSVKKMKGGFAPKKRLGKSRRTKGH